MALDIFITLLLVLLNGFFVAAEFAIVKVRTSQLNIKIEEGSKLAKLAEKIVRNLDGHLAATQLGITLASLGLGWVGEPVVSKLIIRLMALTGISIDPELAHEIALPVAFALITVLHIVFGELAPKSIAIQRSVSVTMIVSYPLRAFYYLFRPFIWMLNGIANALLRMIGIQTVHGGDVHSPDELRYIVQQGRETGSIEEADYDIINNAFNFSERTARQIMVPRAQVFAVDLNSVTDATLDTLIAEGYSRIPCYEGSLDSPAGVVYIKEVLLSIRKGGRIDLHGIMRPVMMIPETKKISLLLKEFQVKHQQIAMVVNEYGATIGIVTMEDILEELVGEIQDESDDEIPLIEQLNDSTYQIVATTGIAAVNAALPRPLDESDQYETLAGMINHKAGYIPNQGEKLSFDGYEIAILKKHKNSIVLVQVRDIGPIEDIED
jgi:CBS domain containing-hemolysin-like protein